MPPLPARLLCPKVHLLRAEQGQAVHAARVAESAEAKPRQSGVERPKRHNNPREAARHRRTSRPTAAFR